MSLEHCSRSNGEQGLVILGPYGLAEPPGDHLSAEVFQNGAQIVPAAAYHFLRTRSQLAIADLVAELVSSLGHYEGMARDQVVSDLLPLEPGDVSSPRSGFGPLMPLSNLPWGGSVEPRFFLGGRTARAFAAQSTGTAAQSTVMANL